jgi:GNAT superfamily N-acetyltransferase
MPQMATPDITIQPTDPAGPEVLALLADMWREESLLYGGDPTGAFPVLDLPPGRGVFLLARAGEQAIGTGALRPVPDEPEVGWPPTAEIKRMYVVPAWRNRGVAGQIMAELERSAREMGYLKLVLETALYQPAAHRLYERSGYRRFACWRPEDAADPLSLCYAKEIAPATAQT